MVVLALVLTACTGGSAPPGSTSTGDTAVDCETVPDRVCGNAALQDTVPGDTGCPEGFSCWGPSAFVCYRGTECNLPICLPPGAAIETPSGPRAVRDLRVGDWIVTADPEGRAVVAPLAALGSAFAPFHHEIVRIVLHDGRTVAASPGHPTADGRRLGDLRVGDELDGSWVASAVQEPYGYARTYDLLPSGPTGLYLADGIWLGSTLR